MAFVRKKTSRGKPVYRVVHNERVNGKIRQRFLCTLGPRSSMRSALAAWVAEIAQLRKQIHLGKQILDDHPKYPMKTTRCWVRRNIKRVFVLVAKIDVVLSVRDKYGPL